ncbi:MAG: dethiobiotin synthase [Thermodesulfobacteriota bacterium]
MSAGLLVVGTDTGVGKTLVCAGLTLALRRAGVEAGYLKPVASGCLPTPAGPASPDAMLVARLAGLSEEPAALNPVCLAAPLAPLAAARAEGAAVDLPAVLAACQEFMATRAFTVVEGVGGLLVPLAPGATLLDLAAGLGLPALVVGRPGLGTVNHTLLTIDALRGRGLAVPGFVFSAAAPLPGDDPSLANNPALVSEFCGAAFLGALPYLGPEEQLDAEALHQAVQRHLDLSLLPPVL